MADVNVPDGWEISGRTLEGEPTEIRNTETGETKSLGEPEAETPADGE
jgi:hypothetical protein